MLLPRAGFVALLSLSVLACGGSSPTTTPADPGPAPSSQPAPPGYTLVWEDDFSAFDSSSWSRGLEDDSSSAHIIWNPHTGGTGLLNDKYASYITDEDAFIENGALVLRNQKRPYTGTDPAGQYEYTSGWVNSMGKRFFNGTARGVSLEIRARFPSGDKVWPAIWLVTEVEHWPPEVDVWEYFGTFFQAAWGTDEMHLRYIFGHWTDPESRTVELEGFDATWDCEAWHVYGYEWTAEAMVWTIDGVEVGRLVPGTGPNDVPEADWPNEDFCLVMNNAVMAAPQDRNTAWPNDLVIDHLALYERTGG